ncbi:MAG: hypothetical protein JNL83_28275 [Myxococcales bacterium]|nr:hypothetical protein [Myxococcales bacterium]
MKQIASLAAAALIASVSAAEAGSAWTAAKSAVPKDTAVLVGIDLVQVSKSSLFQMAMPMMMGKSPELKDALSTIKSACKMDPMQVVQNVVIATDADQEHGAIFFGVRGLDTPKMVSCMEAVAKEKGKKDAKVVAKQDGAITELSVQGDSGMKTVYVSWIGKDVFVLPLQFDSKADLKAWTSGAKGLGKSKVARGAGKVNTSAAAWAVSGMPKDLDDTTKMKSGYASVTMKSGKLGADVHLQLESAAAAKALADRTQQELNEAAAQTGVDPTIKAVLTSTRVAATGDVVAVSAAVAETDVFTLIGALLSK